MAEHSHIFLNEGIVDKIEFSPNPMNIGDDNPIPERDVLVHATNIRSQYEAGVSQAMQQLQHRRDNNQPAADGVYLDIELKGKYPPYQSLDGKLGARLMNISKDEENTASIASVYLPVKNNRWLTKKLDQYVKPVEEGENPSNKPLINSIESINTSTACFPTRKSMMDYSHSKKAVLRYGLMSWMMRRLKSLKPFWSNWVSDLPKMFA